MNLIYGYLLNGNGGGKAIGIDNVSSWVPENGVLWLHFDYTAIETKEWIENEAQLPDLVVEALLQEENRPRTTLIDDGLLIALRGVNLNPGADPEDMIGIRIWTDGARIISTRKRHLLSAKDVVNLIEKGQGPKTVGDFLAVLSDHLITRMHETIENTEDQVAAIEEQILLSEGYALRGQIASLRREVIALRRYLAPQREAMAQMQTVKVSWLDSDDRQRIREVTDDLIRHVEDLDSVRDRAALAQEELSNRLAEQMNNRMYILSIIAAIFLPLGFLTGLLGINVGGIPGAENSLSFWIFSAFLILVVALQTYIFKRNKWF